MAPSGQVLDNPQEGRTDKRGMPHPLDLALFMSRFEAEVKAPFVPPGVVRALMAPLFMARETQGPRRSLSVDGRACSAVRRDSRRPHARPLRTAPRDRKGGNR